MRQVLVWSAVAVLALGACKKKDEGGAGGGGGSAMTFEQFQGKAEYEALMTAAKAGVKAFEENNCDEVFNQAKAAQAALVTLVPDYGAIAEAAKSDEKLSDRMSELNAARAVLEMNTESYGAEEKGSDMATALCDQLRLSLKELAELP